MNSSKSKHPGDNGGVDTNLIIAGPGDNGGVDTIRGTPGSPSGIDTRSQSFAVVELDKKPGPDGGVDTERLL
jgi:hypothetical protein